MLCVGAGRGVCCVLELAGVRVCVGTGRCRRTRWATTRELSFDTSRSRLTASAPTERPLICNGGVGGGHQPHRSHRTNFHKRDSEDTLTIQQRCPTCHHHHHPIPTNPIPKRTQKVPTKMTMAAMMTESDTTTRALRRNTKERSMLCSTHNRRLHDSHR
jgi:hypothetical protein